MSADERRDCANASAHPCHEWTWDGATMWCAGKTNVQAKASAATASPRMAYVARIKDCGCVVAATVDEPQRERETAKFVAKEVRDGFNVERMPVEDARALPWGWPCQHMRLVKAGVAEGQEALDV